MLAVRDIAFAAEFSSSHELPHASRGVFSDSPLLPPALHHASCALNFDEAENIFVPADQVNFSMMPGGAIVARDHYVTASPQIEICVFFPASSNAKMRRAFGIAAGDYPVNYPNDNLCKASRKHWLRVPTHLVNSL